MVFCPKCGKKNPDEHKFCYDCGTTLYKLAKKEKKLRPRKVELKTTGAPPKAEAPAFFRKTKKAPRGAEASLSLGMGLIILAVLGIFLNYAFLWLLLFPAAIFLVCGYLLWPETENKKRIRMVGHRISDVFLVGMALFYSVMLYLGAVWFGMPAISPLSIHLIYVGALTLVFWNRFYNKARVASKNEKWRALRHSGVAGIVAGALTGTLLFGAISYGTDKISMESLDARVLDIRVTQVGMTGANVNVVMEFTRVPLNCQITAKVMIGGAVIGEDKISNVSKPENVNFIFPVTYADVGAAVANALQSGQFTATVQGKVEMKTAYFILISKEFSKTYSAS